MFWTEKFWLNFKTILKDNHYKTIYRPVRSECSSYSVFDISLPSAISSCFTGVYLSLCLWMHVRER